MTYGDDEWQRRTPCSDCGMRLQDRKVATASGPYCCPCSWGWHCQFCYCPALEAWEERELAEDEAGSGETGCDETIPTLDDEPCVICGRAPKDGVPFVTCPDCTYRHCSE